MLWSDESTLEGIDEERQNLLEKLLHSLYGAVDRLRSGICSPECDAMLLGSLIRQVTTVDLLQPRKCKPVHGVSVAVMVKAIESLSTPTWHDSSEVEPVPVVYGMYGSPQKSKKYRRRKEAVPDAMDMARDGHPCTLGELFLGVKNIREEIEGPRWTLKESFGV